jgi:hypothetical protein
MTNINKLKYVKKAIAMDIIKQSITVKLGKQELVNLVMEALQGESGDSIKRVLNANLADKFPQFPEFNQATLGATDENGGTEVTLRIRQERKEKPEEGTTQEQPEESVVQGVE